MFENFATDFIAITNSKSSQDLEKYVSIAISSYPRTNEDNSCVIAVCLNSNLSEDQMLRLGIKYGKYIKENPNYNMNLLCDLNGKLKDISNTNICKFNDLIESYYDPSKSEIQYYIDFNHTDKIGFNLIRESNDIDFIRSMFYFIIITSDFSDELKVLAYKNLKQVNPHIADKIKNIYHRSSVRLHLSYQLNNIDSDIINSIDSKIVYEEFLRVKRKLVGSDFYIENGNKHHFEIIVNKVMSLFIKLDKFNYARETIILSLSAYNSLKIQEHILESFDGKIKKIVDAFNI